MFTYELCILEMKLKRAILIWVQNTEYKQHCLKDLVSNSNAAENLGARTSLSLDGPTQRWCWVRSQGSGAEVSQTDSDLTGECWHHVFWDPGWMLQPQLTSWLNKKMSLKKGAACYQADSSAFRKHGWREEKQESKDPWLGFTSSPKHNSKISNRIPDMATRRRGGCWDSQSMGHGLICLNKELQATRSLERRQGLCRNMWQCCFGRLEVQWLPLRSSSF